MDSQPSDAQAHSLEIIKLLPNLLNLERASLVLFSSRRQMMDVYRGLPEDVEENIFLQGDLSKFEMLRMHCKKIDDGKNSAIFGLTSFSEGIDLPSRYCDHVIIAKIPFSVPDDPLKAALSEWIEDCGGNPFMELSVPEASLRLIQCAGRLLRNEQDTGRITLLDRRIVTRRYGRVILDSLPPFSFQFNLPQVD
jgi:ATP-dependent DNA helicase DinG